MDGPTGDRAMNVNERLAQLQARCSQLEAERDECLHTIGRIFDVILSEGSSAQRIREIEAILIEGGYI